jgi:hypothetical protein
MPSPAAVKQLLAAGADVNSRNPVHHNYTPLHVLAALPVMAGMTDSAGIMQALLGLTPPQVRRPNTAPLKDLAPVQEWHGIIGLLLAMHCTCLCVTLLSLQQSYLTPITRRHKRLCGPINRK